MRRASAAPTPALLSILLAAGAPGAQSQPEAAPPSKPSIAPQPAQPQQIPPQILLGARAEALRQRLAVVPTVVIVPDAASYTAAIAAWSTKVDPAEQGQPGAQAKPVGARFPVLIDDGSWQAGQDIARFVRAFKPVAVLRWSAAPGAKARFDAGPDARKAAIESAAATAWSTPGDQPAQSDLIARWKALAFTPPGVLAASPADPAWTAALALSAGRGEILAWVTPTAPSDVNGAMTLADADALTESLTQACRASGYNWDSLGDALDAVTLCLNQPASVRLDSADPRQFLATTDVIGRDPSGVRSTRWAWAGQIFGSEPRAAYAAMCAIFLMPHTAWLFDGYENSAPWSNYDAGKTAPVLSKVGMSVVVNDDGAQGVFDWRMAAAGMSPGRSDRTHEPPGGIDGGLVMINSSGMPEDFGLRPGQGKPPDTPFLREPALVHIVHSFSAAHPAAPFTVAGRWIERGAYAYAGSVHEPFLDAFVPTPQVALRLTARAPWGVAPRLDGGKVWKIAIIGDPLITLGPLAPRLDNARPPLPDAADMEATLADDLKAERYAAALRTLELLGRDAGAARLVSALAADKPVALTPDVAYAGVMSLYRAPGADEGATRLPLLVRLLSLITDRMDKAPELRDLAWHAAFPVLRTIDPGTTDLLKKCIRPELFTRDTEEVAAAVERSDPRGPEAARDFLSSLRAAQTDPQRRDAIDELMRR